jgi:heavy metal sensor kinase
MIRFFPSWWQRQTLRMRFALSFSLVTTLILLTLLPIVYQFIQGQMLADIDRQLRIDWALIEAHLESDGAGGIQWRKSSPATPQSPGYANSWFDVWENHRPLLQHWPHLGAASLEPPLPTQEQGQFVSVPLSDGRPARTYQMASTIATPHFMLRVFRDESGHRTTLRRIVIGLSLGMPIAVLLAAWTGHAMAGRALRPVGDMAAAARRITSDSLGSRLPNPNPHDELGQLAKVFNDTLERLDASFAALKRFTSDASHELRTPLTALRGVGESALREAKSPEQLRDTIGSMLEETQRLHDLADTLLLIARTESGRMPLQRETVSLSTLTQEVIERLEVLATEKNQALELTASDDLCVQADPVLLRQSLTNLLHNAIAYSPPNSVIQLHIEKRGERVTLSITDRGPGIPIEHREKIFDRFHRIDQARSRADGGTGLGLAIAKLFIEQHGGSIELECPTQGGSIFRIVL